MLVHGCMQACAERETAAQAQCVMQGPGEQAASSAVHINMDWMYLQMQVGDMQCVHGHIKRQ